MGITGSSGGGIGNRSAMEDAIILPDSFSGESPDGQFPTGIISYSPSSSASSSGSSSRNTKTSLQKLANLLSFDKKHNLANKSNIPQSMIDGMIGDIFNGNWDDLPVHFTEWQKSQLKSVGNSTSGANCLLQGWFINEPLLRPGSFCNTTWDNTTCWSAIAKGKMRTFHCASILHAAGKSLYADDIERTFSRTCAEDGTWFSAEESANHTDECFESYDIYEFAQSVSNIYPCILLSGALLSLTFLATALTIFWYFKCLRCDRVLLQCQLMIALALRSLTLIVISIPLVFKVDRIYRKLDWICKFILSTDLYAAASIISWTFVQGLYLHSRIINTRVNLNKFFKIYYLIGWAIPLVFIVLFDIAMAYWNNYPCWMGYSVSKEMDILGKLVIFQLSTNFLFLFNILRVLFMKGLRSSSTAEGQQFRRAVKAGFFLAPILAVNYLLFMYSPEGKFVQIWVFLNTVLGSTQGIFVSIIYCFSCKEVQSALSREYNRYEARRLAWSMDHGRPRLSTRDMILPPHMTTPLMRTRTEFQTKTMAESSFGMSVSDPSPTPPSSVLSAVVSSPASGETSPESG